MGLGWGMETEGCVEWGKVVVSDLVVELVLRREGGESEILLLRMECGLCMNVVKTLCLTGMSPHPVSLKLRYRVLLTPVLVLLLVTQVEGCLRFRRTPSFLPISGCRDSAYIPFRRHPQQQALN